MENELGVDAYSDDQIPFSFNRSKLPPVVRELITAAEHAKARKHSWEASVRGYHERLANKKFTLAIELGVALPALLLWCVLCIVLIASGFLMGWWTLAWLLPTWVMGWVALYLGGMTFHVVRYRLNGYVPIKNAMYQAWGDAWYWHWGFVLLPGFIAVLGLRLLAVFIAPLTPVADHDNARAFRVLGDARVQVALALQSGIATINALAKVLRRERALDSLDFSRTMTSDDVAHLEHFLLELREAALRQVKFLERTHDHAPLGEFQKEIAHFISSHNARMERARKVLADDEARLGALVDCDLLLPPEPQAVSRRKE